MATIPAELIQLYRQTFGGKPFHVTVPNDSPDKAVFNIVSDSNNSIGTGTNLISTDGYGVEIWLPIWLTDFPASSGITSDIFLPYATIKISGSSSVIKTPMAERIGSVKELYSIDDYKITIKGFFIDKQTRSLPIADLQNLKKVHEQGTAFNISNAITDIFLNGTFSAADEQQRVIITSFDLPEVEGGKKSMRPFVMNLESDSVFTLEYTQ